MFKIFISLIITRLVAIYFQELPIENLKSVKQNIISASHVCNGICETCV